MRHLTVHIIAAVSLSIGSSMALAPATLAANAPSAVAQARMNPNTATDAQLRAAGLSAATAQAVLRARPFASQSAFAAVAGAGLNAEQASALYTKVFVPINLNTASREDIALIPGMTPRMIREFFEYRPYTSMDQFNREMAKYVPPAEVARLASYVTLR